MLWVFILLRIMSGVLFDNNGSWDLIHLDAMWVRVKIVSILLSLLVSWSWIEDLGTHCKENLLKDITRPTHEELRDMFSAELHRQLQPLKDMINQKDQEILELKKAVVDLRSELDQLEQHGRRDSLGIPENPAHDNTDNKILDIPR